MRIVNLEIVNNCEQLWTFVKKNHCEFEKNFWKIHKSSQKFTIGTPPFEVYGTVTGVCDDPPIELIK